ncbi:(2Fe-2S)-binding protein [Cellvibrio zantedeschiae]|uniref:(2Fe-2S)-binding protein n=1 Tax=Cellvibrio zantedeschiae TaxID=1237077 RepID=A0ABQ3B3R3_9GAMM|nr:(2Fe-2S)-binding protein [Cellvibrio zantedeschiae]GGY73816.1 (2Fe-2S)-binding protein [Cellvibrio zantedeschiae]
MISLTINGKAQQINVDPDTPLLWVLRDELKMTGTKLGCGMAMCGACTVHMNGSAVRSCSVPLSAAQGANIQTIEGMNSPAFQAVQQAWRNLDVVQCGYCQSGQIMSATALLQTNSKPTDSQIDAAMMGNLCRCATYHRIRNAIHQAADNLGSKA